MTLTPQDKNEVRQIVREEIEDNNQKIEQLLVDFRSDFYEKIDPVLKEVVASREERAIIAEKLAEHQNHIEKLQQAA